MAMHEDGPDDKLVLRILGRYALGNRKFIGFLLVSLILDIVFTAAIGYGAVHLHTVSQQAAIQSCEYGNKFRKNDKQLWEVFLREIKHEHPTIRQERIQIAMHKQVDITMSQRKCKGL
jgi:hypothetical protein